MMVSVVVVTYNQSSIVEETLDSIYNQSYPSLEIIISDDCSKDNTLEIIENWLDRNKGRFVNTRLLKSEINTGVTANCNRGVMAATGKYMQIIAGDDILLPNAIEEKVQFAEVHNLKYVVCKVEPFGENQKVVDDVTDWCERGYNTIRNGYDSQLNAILRSNFFPGPCGSFYLLKWFKEFGAYDECYPMVEDYPFVFRFIVSGYQIHLLERVLEKYRVYQGSLSSSAKSLMWKSNWSFYFHECLPETIKRGKIGTVIYMIFYFIYYKFIRDTCVDKILFRKPISAIMKMMRMNDNEKK